MSNDVTTIGLASVAQLIRGLNGQPNTTRRTADDYPSYNLDDSAHTAEYPVPSADIGLASPAVISIHDPYSFWQFLEPPLRQRLGALRYSWGDGRVLRDIDFEFSTNESDKSRRFVASQAHAYQSPYLHIYVLKCEDLETYRGQVRPRLRAWVNDMNQRGEEWLLVYIPLATDAIQSNSMPRKIFDKLRVDFGSSSPTGSSGIVTKTSAARRLVGAAAAAGMSVNTSRRNSLSGSSNSKSLSANDRCCRVALFDEPNQGISPTRRKSGSTAFAESASSKNDTRTSSSTSSSGGGGSDPSSGDTIQGELIRRNAGDGQWGELLHRLGRCIISTFESRRKQVSLYLNKLPLSANTTNAIHVFTGAENLIGMWMQLRQWSDALDFYLDLSNQFDIRFRKMEVKKQQQRRGQIEKLGGSTPPSTTQQSANVQSDATAASPTKPIMQASPRIILPSAPMLIGRELKHKSSTSKPDQNFSAHSNNFKDVSVLPMRRWLFNVMPPTAAELAAQAPNFAIELQPYLFSRVVLLHFELGNVDQALQYAINFIIQFERTVLMNIETAQPQAYSWGLFAALETLGAGLTVLSRMYAAADADTATDTQSEGRHGTGRQNRRIAAHCATLFGIIHSSLDRLFAISVFGGDFDCMSQVLKMTKESNCPFSVSCALSTLVWRTSSQDKYAGLHQVSSWINSNIVDVQEKTSSTSTLSGSGLPAPLETLLCSNDQRIASDMVMQLLKSQTALLLKADRRRATARLSLKLGLTLMCRSRWLEARIEIGSAKRQWAAVSPESRAEKGGPNHLVYGIPGSGRWSRLDTVSGLSLLDCLCELRDYVEIIRTGTIVLANSNGSLGMDQRSLVHVIIRNAILELTGGNCNGYIGGDESIKDVGAEGTIKQVSSENRVVMQLEHGSLFSISILSQDTTKVGTSGNGLKIENAQRSSAVVGEVAELVVMVESHMQEPLTVCEAGLDFRLDYLAMPGQTERGDGDLDLGSLIHRSRHRPRHVSMAESETLATGLDSKKQQEQASLGLGLGRDLSKEAGVVGDANEPRVARVNSLVSETSASTRDVGDETGDSDDDCDSRTVGSNDASTDSENEAPLFYKEEEVNVKAILDEVTDNRASDGYVSGNVNEEVDVVGEEEDDDDDEDEGWNAHDVTMLESGRPPYRSRSMDMPVPNRQPISATSDNVTGVAGLHADPQSDVVLVPGQNVLRFNVKTTGAVAGEYTIRRLWLRIGEGGGNNNKNNNKYNNNDNNNNNNNNNNNRELEFSCAFNKSAEVTPTLLVRALPLQLDALLISPPMLVARPLIHKVVIRMQIRGLAGIHISYNPLDTDEKLKATIDNKGLNYLASSDIVDKSTRPIIDKGLRSPGRSHTDDTHAVTEATAESAEQSLHEHTGTSQITTAELRVSLTDGRGRVSLDRIGIIEDSTRGLTENENMNGSSDGLVCSSTSAHHTRFLDSSLFLPISSSILARATSSQASDVDQHVDVCVWISVPVSRSSMNEASLSGLNVALTLFSGVGGPTLGRSEKRMDFTHGRPLSISTYPIIPPRSKTSAMLPQSTTLQSQNTTMHQELILKICIRSLAPTGLWVDSHKLQLTTKTNQTHKQSQALTSCVSASPRKRSDREIALLSPGKSCFLTYYYVLNPDVEGRTESLDGILSASMRWLAPSSSAHTLRSKKISDISNSAMEIELPVQVSLHKQAVISLCQVECETNIAVGHVLHVKYILEKQKNVWTVTDVVENDVVNAQNADGNGYISNGSICDATIEENPVVRTETRQTVEPNVRFCVKLRGRGWLVAGVDRGLLTFEKNENRASYELACVSLVLVAMQPGPHLLPVLETVDESLVSGAREQLLDPCLVVEVSQY